MSRYFSISQGLRGCYLPDSAYVIRVDTRKELKAALESEAYSIRDAGFIGANKRAVAWLAATLWRTYRKAGQMDSVVPYRNPGQNSYPYGLFGSAATRADWLESQAENN